MSVRGTTDAAYALLGVRRGCGCVRLAALVESPDDRLRLERAWERDGLVVVPTNLNNGRVRLCGKHKS